MKIVSICRQYNPIKKDYTSSTKTNDTRITNNVSVPLNYQPYGYNISFGQNSLNKNPDTIAQTITALKKRGVEVNKNIRYLQPDTTYPKVSIELEDAKRALNFLNRGIDTNCLNLYLSLNTKELDEAVQLSQEGYPPIVAGYFTKLTEEQRTTALNLLDFDADMETAAQIAQVDEKSKKQCLSLIRQGIHPVFAIELSQLNEYQQKRLSELISLKVDDESLFEFIQMDNETYKKAIELLKKKVFSSYIATIIDDEEKGTSFEYDVYRERNYSQSAAFSISLLQDEEIDALIKLIEKNPEIKTLFEDEYAISIVDIQNDDTYEAILTKEIRTEEGTKITLTITYDEYGVATRSRTEEYADKSTSSIMSGRSGTFKIKYDKYGEIRELTQYIQDPETNAVTGVIHSVSSEILNGAFNSTYYDISQFKEDDIGEKEAVDADIQNSTTSEGIPISMIKKNSDGSITYTENISLNDTNTDRTYTEKRDHNGNIIFSSYRYKIQNEDSDIPLMDINRSVQKNSDGSIDNTINGVNYHIEYNDKDKVIRISDGKKNKVLNIKDKLSQYSADVLWEAIKNLQADALLYIFDRIEQWNFCLDSDSYAEYCNKLLSTSNNTSIILHEIGHFIANEEPSILDNDDFIQSYGKEMSAFQINIPYNEQKFLQYFSPRANLADSDGDDEFIAETNILLTTYGTNTSKIKTRTQLLAKYCPKTIALIANLTGKTSKESLLK